MARSPKSTSPPAQPEPPAQSTTVHPTGSQGAAPMSTFSDILDTPLDAIEAPKPIPVGSYIAVIDGNYETGESSKQKTPYVRFQFRLLQAMEDANPEEVEAAKAIGKKVRQDFYLTEDALFRLKRFLADTLDIQAGNLKEALSQTPAKQLVVVMHHELTQPIDGSEPQVISRVKNTLKV